ncbi:MAG TPA: uridine phosphorylase [Thermodesulfobacteriota bacterium]|nr:uridine phosphorylase [Thermodesulfobacteriota bacterium]
MPNVYHLDLNKKIIRGAEVAFLPGDPARSEAIARRVSEVHATPYLKLASKREFTTFLSETARRRVLVTSTGIGGPSTSIAIEELARLGVRTFIRVGTTGSIQDHLKVGDCVITTGAVRLDGASTHYAPIEYPAVADYGVTNALVRGAEKAGVRHHVGITASSDTFYQGEEREDSFRKYIIRGLRGSAREWRELGVLNYEMESSTLLTITSSMGLRGGCITGVINRAGRGGITASMVKKGVENVIRAAVAALEFL